MADGQDNFEDPSAAQAWLDLNRVVHTEDDFIETYEDGKLISRVKLGEAKPKDDYAEWAHELDAVNAQNAQKRTKVLDEIALSHWASKKG